jgi:hypothetical protein
MEGKDHMVLPPRRLKEFTPIPHGEFRASANDRWIVVFGVAKRFETEGLRAQVKMDI